MLLEKGNEETKLGLQTVCEHEIMNLQNLKLFITHKRARSRRRQSIPVDKWKAKITYMYKSRFVVC